MKRGRKEICRFLRMAMLGLSLALASCAYAQEEAAADSVRKVFPLPEVPDTLILAGRETLVYYPKQLDEMPKYPGGMEQLMRFLADNFKHTTSCYQPVGRITSRILIDREGDIKQADIVEPLDKDMDEELLRVISLMPQFKPAEIGSEKVDCWYYLPVNFRDSEQ